VYKRAGEEIKIIGKGHNRRATAFRGLQIMKLIGGDERSGGITEGEAGLAE